MTDDTDNSTTSTSTTTERYRISRQEFGRILGRNFRGLQKLLRLELNDAANVRQAKTKRNLTSIFDRFLFRFLAISNKH